jgi:hypothetical protein
MIEVKLIITESLTDLEPNEDFLVLDTTTGTLYRGDGDSTLIKISDENNSNFASKFLLMGA